jgi:hypothetical protein
MNMGFITFPQQIRVAPRGVNMLPKDESVRKLFTRPIAGGAGAQLQGISSIYTRSTKRIVKEKAQIAASRGTCHTGYRT